MNKYLKICLFGFLVWLIPLIVSFLIFGLHEDYRPLFESIMAVAVTLSVVLFSVLYFKTVDKDYVKEGVMIGITWLIINLIIDLIIMVLLESPMQMSIGDYMMDIGLTYVIIPVITIGFGMILEKR
ncbi:MAG: hypothetical protein KAQ84_01340 [Thermoplasmatales archaeon]|nr:hypothetical protein [Thermoplasmatales archaeon]